MQISFFDLILFFALLFQLVKKFLLSFFFIISENVTKALVIKFVSVNHAVKRSKRDISGFGEFFNDCSTRLITE